MAPLTCYSEGIPLHGLKNCFFTSSEGQMILLDKAADGQMIAPADAGWYSYRKCEENDLDFRAVCPQCDW